MIGGDRLQLGADGGIEDGDVVFHGSGVGVRRDGVTAGEGAAAEEAQAESVERSNTARGLSRSQAGAIEEIVVQARKRAEFLEDTPVSVTALGVMPNGDLVAAGSQAPRVATWNGSVWSPVGGWPWGGPVRADREVGVPGGFFLTDLAGRVSLCERKG